MKPSIVIVDGQNNRYVDNQLELERAIIQDHAQLTLREVQNFEELLRDETVQQADVLVCWHAVEIPVSLINTLRRCKGIVRPAVGFDNINIKAARKQGIPVIIIPDYGTEEVADHTMALLLACTRNLIKANETSKKVVWDWKNIGFDTIRLRGSQVGIVGMGRIGKAVALRMKAFGLHVFYYDPYEKSGLHKSLGIEEMDSLEELYALSDIISFHVPLNEETRHILNRQNLHLIKDSAIVINTCRGSVLEEAALIELLERPGIRMGLDVMEFEPVVPAAFKNNDRVVLSGHSAFYSEASLLELKTRAIKTALMVLQKKHIKNIIN